MKQTKLNSSQKPTPRLFRPEDRLDAMATKWAKRAQRLIDQRRNVHHHARGALAAY